MSPLYWAMVTLTLKGEKSSFKGSWSGLLLTWSKIDDTALGLQKQCTASQGISGQHNCQPGGPDKHKHKMCHLWLDGCTCGAMWLDVHWERDKGPLYFHSSSLKEGQQFLPHAQCWWGDAKGCSNIRQPASLLRGCSSCEAWLSFKQQEETASPFPRSLADNSGDCKCLAKCFLSHFANKAEVRSFLPVEI